MCADRLSAAGRYAGVLDTAQEAVALRRELVGLNRDAHLPDLMGMRRTGVVQSCVRAANEQAARVAAHACNFPPVGRVSSSRPRAR